MDLHEFSGKCVAEYHISCSLQTSNNQGLAFVSFISFEVSIPPRSSFLMKKNIRSKFEQGYMTEFEKQRFLHLTNWNSMIIALCS